MCVDELLLLGSADLYMRNEAVECRVMWVVYRDEYTTPHGSPPWGTVSPPTRIPPAAVDAALPAAAGVRRGRRSGLLAHSMAELVV